MRLLFLGLVGSLLLSACASTRAVPLPYPGMSVPRTAGAGGVPTADPSPGTAESTNDAARPESSAGPRRLANLAVDVAEGLLGAPYRSGGSGPDAFDCSGFVQYVFARAGASLPRSVREQWGATESVEAGDVRRGDLVFFAIGGDEVSHVGVALDAGTFVHAPSARGVVRAERLSADYWARRFVGARRVAAE